MSVAFRRDNDEEHKEPRFELPIPAGPNLVTARGLQHIQDKVSTLAASLETLTEEEQRESCKRDLRYWRARASSAQLAPPPPDDEIAFGSRVQVMLNSKERIFSIVGDDEADPNAGLISFTSPLARALIGAYAGDIIDFGGKAEAIEIIAIAAIEDEPAV